MVTALLLAAGIALVVMVAVAAKPPTKDRRPMPKPQRDLTRR